MQRLTCFVPSVHAQAQRVIVKGKIVRAGSTTHRSMHGLTKSYLAYIHRDGVGEDGQRPTFFNQDGLATRKAFLEQVRHDTMHFSWIISPEHGHRLDMDSFTRQLMERVSTDLRVEFDWIASSHYNTPHPHSHVIARATDRHGKPFEIDNAYLRVGLKNEARELATRELGPQHDFDWEYERDLTRDIHQEITRDIHQEITREHALAHARDVIHDWQQEHVDLSQETPTRSRVRDLLYEWQQDHTPTRQHEREPTQSRDKDHGLSW